MSGFATSIGKLVGKPADAHKSANQYSTMQTHCAKRESKSQWKEDLRLLSLLVCAAGGTLSKPIAGHFVEMGAFDGVTHSNTFMLERCMKWKGTLLEANPNNYKTLMASPRNVTKKWTAICAEKGELKFDDNVGENSAAADAMDDGDPKHAHKKMVSVPCDKLSNVLSDAGAPNGGADFLSLDVEGSEATVLKTIYPGVFKVVIVETFQCCPDGLSTAAALKQGKSCQCEGAKGAHGREVANLLAGGGLVRVPHLESVNHINHVHVRTDVLTRCNRSIYERSPFHFLLAPTTSSAAPKPSAKAKGLSGPQTKALGARAKGVGGKHKK